ncbi:MAG: hypothetical protein IJU26_02680 [Synergistaceae bacterium]|nr:hypothetical protein [Synergistaceae bacterium]
MKLTRTAVIFGLGVCLGLMVCASDGYALPAKYDLRDYGRISPVKNQGLPGPCWAFAALGAMESNYLTQSLHTQTLHTGGKTSRTSTQTLSTNAKIPDLSEMQLAFYTYKDPDKKRCFTPLYSSGTLSLEGSAFRAAAFLLRLSGPTEEKSLRYNTQLPDSEKKALAKKSPESFRRVMRLRDVYFLAGDQTLNDTAKKELIMQHGAIYISMYSDPMNYRNINGHYTYYNPEHGKDTDHDVLLAGWDDDFPAGNFSPRPSRNGAWLVKNSWGTMRGSEGGYFWMSYDQHTWGGTAFVVERANQRMRHYGYDDLGFCTSVKYSWGANIFRTRTRRENLREAAFYAPGNNLGYEVYVYDLGYKIPESPVAGTLVSHTKGSVKFAGYYTVNLPEAVSLKEGQYFSVVVKFSGGYMPVECKVARYSENAEVNERESWFSRDGRSWLDGVSIKSNACIKAYTLMK